MKVLSDIASFDALLSILDNDRENAGVVYEQLRARLIGFFEWRGCGLADQLADVCFDRMAKKIADGEVIQSPSAYIATIAQFVYREHLRSAETRHDSIDNDDSSITEIEANESVWNEDVKLSCLDKCLDEFSPADRNVITSYYDTEERTMIDSRRRLAENMAISMNTLRIKVCRLRSKLESCISECCDRRGDNEF